MAVDQDAEQQYVPEKKKMSPEEEKTRKKIVPGSLMKAEIWPGIGGSGPSDGDQVIYHCTVRTLEGVVVESTKSEFGGKGVPIRQVMGKSKMILGLLECIPTMLKGEVSMFKMKPEMHYGGTDYSVSATERFPEDDELHFEIEMIDFFKVKVISNDDMGVIKRILDDGQGWESPREPYEVKACAPDTLKTELRSIYGQPCQDDMSMVRRSAAFGKFAATIEPAHVKNDIMSIFEELTRDDQDSVRLLAVEGCAALGKLLEPQDCVSHILPVIVSFSQTKDGPGSRICSFTW